MSNRSYVRRGVPTWEPTPEEIKVECEKIREGWTEHTRQTRIVDFYRILDFELHAVSVKDVFHNAKSLILTEER